MNTKLSSRMTTTDEAAASLLDMLVENLLGRRQPDRRIVLARLLRLGLLDEILQLLSQTSLGCARDLRNIVEHIEKLIENRYFNTLDGLNPILKQTTLDTTLQCLRDEDDKDLTTNVITTVIFAISIFLMKLEANNADTLRESMADLELAFEYLAKFLDELIFSASDILVRATKLLVGVIKAKLDTLVDNELIRASFKALIETVAGRCLIESRYKSAAMLYGQIEDNVNAVKALMRAGDVETVINFSLLVRDITVNRITMNYLKHLNVDIKIIEDFITRARP